jgi:2-haloacid dehalogenase/putative hydrolase of the HAD superfamily
MPSDRFDVLFIDFYGTLADGDRHAVETTCARVVEDYNLPTTAREFAVTWGRVFFAEIERANHDDFLNLYECEAKSLIDTLAPEGIEVDPHPYCKMLKHYWATAPLQPESLDALAGIDIPICCVSNADNDDIVSAIELRGLQLEHVVTSEDTRCYKPDPHIFEVALERMGVSPDRVLHVGDSLHSDVGGAAKLGITTVWVCREDRIFDAGDATPNHKIGSLMELHSIL